MARVQSSRTAMGSQPTYGFDSVGKRQRKYVYGRSREIVHSRWVELTRKAARGPVVTKVPTVGEFLHRWLEDTVAPNLAPLTYATYESHVQNYIEPGLGALRLDRLRVADVQGGSIAWPHNANAARRERTPVGRSTGRPDAARSGSAVTGSRPRHNPADQAVTMEI